MSAKLEVVHERKLPKPLITAISVLCILGTLFYLWAAYVGDVGEIRQRGPVLLICFIIVFLTKPISSSLPELVSFALDIGLSLLAIVTCIYMISTDFWSPIRLITKSTPMELFFCGALIVLVLEGCRRTAGWALTILAILSILYVKFGMVLPGILHHRDFPWDYILRYSAISRDVIWGMPIHVAATVVVIFVIFGAFLQTSGGGWFFVELPRALLGHVRGGPAKMAVVGSGLFGTISGSPMANVAAVGTFTIPLMKSMGYSPETAGAIEALASTGGQYMPPVMGITAFIIPQVLGISYLEVCAAALLPAVIFYIALFIQVDLEAAKLGIKGVPRKDLPSVRKTVARGWPLLIPLFVLIFLLAVLKWTPTLSAFWAVVAMVGASMVTKETRMSPKQLMQALDKGMKGMPMITMTCAAAGIMVGMLNMGGLGINLSFILVEASHGNLLVLLLLVAVASLIMGMGLVTTVIYLLLAFLVAPALVQMGVMPLAAHLFIFYFGVLSCITPPVAVACFAASPIAGANPIKIGLVATRMGIVIYFIPFFFVYGPALLMKGAPVDIALTVVAAILSCLCVAVASVGYLFRRATPLERVVFGIAAFWLLFPGLYAHGVGLVFMALGVILHRRKFVAKGSKNRIEEAK